MNLQYKEHIKVIHNKVVFSLKMLTWKIIHIIKIKTEFKKNLN